MQYRCFYRLLGSGLGVVVSFAAAQRPPNTPAKVPVHLQVDAGRPLRLYITKRLRYRAGEPVEAKLAEPVWAFDRIVIPTGTSFEGEVSELDPVPKMVRAMAMVRGDFTPLKEAKVTFTKMLLPDGRTMEIDSVPSFGLQSIYVPAGVKKHTKQHKHATKPRDPNSRTAKMLRFARQQAEAQANARSRGLFGFVRGPNRREWLESFLWSKVPYHPQWYHSGTRFDAVLERPIDFGEGSVATAELKKVGTDPPPDSVAQVRFLSTISSVDGKRGDPISGELSQPLFAADHELILPQGTRLVGKLTLVRHARMFHRGGQLRFTFDSVELPKIAGVDPPATEATYAQLTAAEETHGPVKVDSEGTAKATESKTRFLRPVIAGLVAAKSMDNDTGRQTASGGANANPVGTSLGGFSGFGLLGTAASRAPAPIGTVLGFYGLGWSVYSTVVSRGREVAFQKNAATEIRFGAREHRQGTRQLSKDLKEGHR